MNKLSRLMIAALVGMSLSMPAFAKEANGKAKTAAHKTHAQKKGATVGKKTGQTSTSESAAPAKGKSHKMQSTKKGATEGKKTGETKTPKTVAQTKGAPRTARSTVKTAKVERKHGPVVAATKARNSGKKAGKNQKVKS